MDTSRDEKVSFILNNPRLSLPLLVQVKHEIEKQTNLTAIQYFRDCINKNNNMKREDYFWSRKGIGDNFQ